MRAARAYGIGLGMTDLDVSPGWWRRPLLAPVVGLFGRLTTERLEADGHPQRFPSRVDHPQRLGPRRGGGVV